MRKLLISSVVSLIGLLIILGFLHFRDGGSSDTVVEAIEKARDVGYVNYIIHEHPVQDGVVVFFLRNMNDGQISVNSEYVRRTRQGWIWGYGGGFSGSNVRLDLTEEEARKESFQSAFFHSTEGTEFDSPFPMIYGVILNPDITRIVIKDYVKKLERQANIVEVNRNFKLFYLLLEQGGKFDITAYEEDGKVIKVELIDEESHAGGNDVLSE